MSHNFDRFKEPVDPIEVATCEHCGGEIYLGDEVRLIDSSAGFGGGVVHDNGKCAEAYAMDCIYGDRGVITRTGEVE